MHRRHFLLTSSAAAYAAPPSDRINLGVIGAGGRGTFVMTVFQENTTVKVTALCHVYEPNLERGLSTVKKKQRESAKAYRGSLLSKTASARLSNWTDK